jgi:hypothetical protein
MKYVIYESCIDNEVIVVAKKEERKVITEFFGESSGRDLDDYERTVVTEPPMITCRTIVD